ncbi:hypothetical protein KC19_10G103700 [Ceratodon purpureus]|uniref:Secreted protein n=1 Tax=Ceratodon purpureus TaxID=3225 RepID=A0A8T0GLJ3_CERPU|nr:hypothetical protein KC19_10G103700 [Ceratodon purpureus]
MLASPRFRLCLFLAPLLVLLRDRIHPVPRFSRNCASVTGRTTELATLAGRRCRRNFDNNLLQCLGFVVDV